MHAALGTEGDELLSIEGDRRSNRCTARCLDARADLRAAVLGAVAEGQGSRRVSAAFGVSREVVRALRRQALESGELDLVKQSIGLDALALAREAIDRCRDEIDEMPRASLPVLAGIMTDKALLLTGGATVRIEHVTGPTHAGLNDMLASLGVIEVQASAPAPAPVEAWETSAQKGADLAAGRRIEAAAGIKLDAFGDIQSLGASVRSEVSAPPCADSERMTGADAEVRP
jgi:hypothetical protein